MAVTELSILHVFFRNLDSRSRLYFPFKLKNVRKSEFERERKAQTLSQVSDTWKPINLGIHLGLRLTIPGAGSRGPNVEPSLETPEQVTFCLNL